MRILLAAAMAGLLVLPASAQERPGTITTHATARARLTNTVADVAVGIEAHARTIAAVHKTLADGSGALLAYLRGAGAERLRTEQVAVTPDTQSDPRGGQPERIVGYAGRMQVSFRVAADKLSDLLGGVLNNGGNTIDNTLLVPRDSEVEAARQELAATAVKTALAQARVVAEAAGRRLGPVQQIIVDPGLGLAPRPMPMFAAARMAPSAPIATESGESEVAATVSVVSTLSEP